MTQFSNKSLAGLNASLTTRDLDAIGYEESVYIWILSIVEIPVVLLTLFAMCLLMKSYAASVYVINLILSDLLQIVIILLLTTQMANIALWCAYKYCLIVGLYFMACIAFERYLLVSHPHWYRSYHSVKSSCFISMIIWFVPLIFAQKEREDLFSIFSQSLAFFIPYPIIILCFVGTWRGLSQTVFLTSQKRKVILGSLSLVLLNYTFLILPLSFTSFCLTFLNNVHLDHLFVYCHWLLYLNPLADCLLYLFMRSDVDNILKSLYCCCSSDSCQNPTQHSICTNTEHNNVH